MEKEINKASLSKKIGLKLKLRDESEKSTL